MPLRVSSIATHLALFVGALANVGCYAQVSGGVYSVHGGLARGAPTPAAVVPSIGVALGVAYDPVVVRALAGAGTQGVPIPNRAPSEVALTGPVHLQFDVGAPVRRSILRAGVGGTMQFGRRFVTNPADGVLEARPFTVAHVYLPLTADLFVGQLDRGFLTVGLSLAPAMFVGLGNRDLSDYFGFGGDARLTIALPIPRGQFPSIGGIFEARLRPDQERELEQLYQDLPNILARQAAENSAADRGRAMQQHQQYLRLQCIRDGRSNC